MKILIHLTPIDELKSGDVFTFRKDKRPIWWKFIKIKDNIFVYEGIKSKIKHSALIGLNAFVLKKY